MGDVVAAGDKQTAEAGMELLRAGGNAIDAVVGAAFASWVVEPPLGSAAGAGLLLHGSVDHGFELLDFFTRVPGLGLNAPPKKLDFYGKTIDFGPTSQEFHIGRGSVAVPTAIWGLLEAHDKNGVLPLHEIVQPALSLAREWVISQHIQWVLEFLSPILTETASVRKIHCKDGELPKAGMTMSNPGLVRFFEGLAAGGHTFLDGPFLDAILAEFGPEHGGLLTRQDFTDMRIRHRVPLRTSFAGHTVLTPPPPASGGALVGLSLTLAERLQLTSHPWQSSEWCALCAKILHAVSVARGSGFDAHVFQENALDSLFSAPSLERWMQEAAREERCLGETTHISVMDKSGGVASFTMSNGEGCGHALNDFGVHLNNFLGEEDINPHGWHTQPAGHPMTTMMTPSIVLDPQGIPVFVVGSGGANRIRSAVFQAIVARIGHSKSMEASVEAPRLHVEGEHVWFETEGLSKAAIHTLSAWENHTAFPDRNMFFGGVNVVGRDSSGVHGAGDGRRGGRFVIRS